MVIEDDCGWRPYHSHPAQFVSIPGLMNDLIVALVSRPRALESVRCQDACKRKCGEH
jgi:hypothetical protein